MLNYDYVKELYTAIQLIKNFNYLEKDNLFKTQNIIIRFRGTLKIAKGTKTNPLLQELINNVTQIENQLKNVTYKQETKIKIIKNIQELIDKLTQIY